MAKMQETFDIGFDVNRSGLWTAFKIGLALGCGFALPVTAILAIERMW